MEFAIIAALFSLNYPHDLAVDWHLPDGRVLAILSASLCRVAAIAGSMVVHISCMCNHLSVYHWPEASQYNGYWLLAGMMMAYCTYSVQRKQCQFCTIMADNNVSQQQQQQRGQGYL